MDQRGRETPWTSPSTRPPTSRPARPVRGRRLGQGRGKTWTRAGGVKLARYGNAYTGTTKVGKGNAITFRLIKVDANGKTTWDSAKDRKSKADKTKALGVSWTSGKVNEDGTIPDDSAISISGKGVADGKLSIQKGNLAELYVIAPRTPPRPTLSGGVTGRRGGLRHRHRLRRPDRHRQGEREGRQPNRHHHHHHQVNGNRRYP